MEVRMLGEEKREKSNGSGVPGETRFKKGGGGGFGVPTSYLISCASRKVR
jgi:hypothetical protein